MFITVLYLPFGLAIRAPWFLISRPSLALGEYVISPLRSIHFLIYDIVQRDGKAESLKEVETIAIMDEGDRLHYQMCAWLMRTSSTNPSAKSAIFVVAGCRPKQYCALQASGNFESRLEPTHPALHFFASHQRRDTPESAVAGSFGKSLRC